MNKAPFPHLLVARIFAQHTRKDRRGHVSADAVRVLATNKMGQIQKCQVANGSAPLAYGSAQLFFRSIFKFRSISLRLSKLEMVRVGDLAPSFSACTS